MTRRGVSHFSHAAFEQRGKLARGYRFAEIVALGLVTMVRLEELQLGARFYAFRNHLST